MFVFVWPLVEVEIVEFFGVLFGNRFVETKQNIVQNLLELKRLSVESHHGRTIRGLSHFTTQSCGNVSAVAVAVAGAYRPLQCIRFGPAFLAVATVVTFEHPILRSRPAFKTRERPLSQSVGA